MGSDSNTTDRLALLSFKAKITSDPFGIMSLWNDTIPLCEWYGVTCGIRHKRVTQLNLVSLKLGGSISPHVGNLSFLQVLRLHQNRLIGQIPPQIGRLRRLQELSLTNNTFCGEIPVNLSSCTHLWYLSLSSTNLEGKIPPELGSLSKLQDFRARENNLTGALPSSFGNLTSLRMLLVSYNNLFGRIPETLGRLSYLKYADILMNHFYGDISFFFNISSMIALDIGFNQFGGRLPPDLFQSLPNLQILSIEVNQFSGPIPVSISNASNMNVVQLGGNKLTGKVPSLERLNKLRVLSMNNNNLGSGDGSQDNLNFICSLVNATMLHHLVIHMNNFGGILPGCISNLSSQLRILSMSGNYISGSIPSSIDNLIGLQILSIVETSVTGNIPSTIGNMRNLAWLYLCNNILSGLIPSSLGKLSRLYGLWLNSNGLEGPIPSSLGNCTSLQTLFLKQNKLTGSIPPSLLLIPSLTITLSLSDNRLTGLLPEQVGKLTNLNELDVAANMLSGKIPDSLGQCASLEFLNLRGNIFQGSIPTSFRSMRGLQSLDLSSNNLSGQIPSFLASFTGLKTLNLSFNDLQGPVLTKGVFGNASVTSLQGNYELCGGIPEFHLPKCSGFRERNKRRMAIKKKITIVTIVGISGVSLLVVVLLLIVFISRRKERRNRVKHAVSSLENPPLKFVSYGDLHRATHGFSEGSLVGEGGFGNVYRGNLGEGQVVAIKVINLNRLYARKSFAAECVALRNIRHRNLVKMLTVCSGTDYQGNEFKALVYEFMPNGSLENWLHPHDVTVKEEEVVDSRAAPGKLGFLQRLSIAIDVSSLLEYVHHGFGVPLVHCDIKPSNILLDGDLSGRVSDFGLAKFLSDSGVIRNSVPSSSSMGIRGTVGYAPPEYGLGSEVSNQGDIYSFGILLLEMLTGKKPTHEIFKDGLNLHMYAKMALASGVVDILDPTLNELFESEDLALNPRRSTRVMQSLIQVIEIGVACSRESPNDRTEMRVVAAKLHKIRDSLLRRNMTEETRDRSATCLSLKTSIQRVRRELKARTTVFEAVDVIETF